LALSNQTSLLGSFFFRQNSFLAFNVQGFSLTLAVPPFFFKNFYALLLVVSSSFFFRGLFILEELSDLVNFAAPVQAVLLALPNSPIGSLTTSVLRQIFFFGIPAVTEMSYQLPAPSLNPFLPSRNFFLDLLVAWPGH